MPSTAATVSASGPAPGGSRDAATGLAAEALDEVLQPDRGSARWSRRSGRCGVVPGQDGQATPRAAPVGRGGHGGEIRSSPRALPRGSHALPGRRGVECPGAADADVKVANAGATLRRMTYVIAEPCIDVLDLSCVSVCPVDCIHYEEGVDRKLFIDPNECIDCGACEPECPVNAIFPEDQVPAEWANYTHRRDLVHRSGGRPAQPWTPRNLAERAPRP